MEALGRGWKPQKTWETVKDGKGLAGPAYWRRMVVPETMFEARMLGSCDRSRSEAWLPDGSETEREAPCGMETLESQRLMDVALGQWKAMEMRTLESERG